MRPPGVVVADPSSEASLQLCADLKCMRIDTFVVKAPPQLFDEHVVHPPITPVHGDAHLRVLQHIAAPVLYELAVLVDAEDLWPSVADQNPFECLNAKRGVQDV